MPRPKRDAEAEQDRASGTLREWLRTVRKGNTLERMTLTKAERAALKTRMGQPVSTQEDLDEDREDPPPLRFSPRPRRTRRSISTRVGLVG